MAPAHSEVARRKHVQACHVREAYVKYASELQIRASVSPLPEGIDPFYLGVVPPPPALAPAAPVDAPLMTLSKGQWKKANKKRHLEEGNVSA